MAEEGRRVRLRVVSRMTDPEGEVFEQKNARTGSIVETPQGVTLDYDDVQDGERAHITLAARAAKATMRRRGMTRAELSFVPGERSAGRYETLYGEIPVAIFTRSVALSRQESGGELTLDYDVYIAGERTSSAALTVTWRL